MKDEITEEALKKIVFVEVGIQSLCHLLKDKVLQEFDEVCGKKRCGRGKEDAWWWNEEVKEAMSGRMHTW